MLRQWTDQGRLSRWEGQAWHFGSAMGACEPHRAARFGKTEVGYLEESCVVVRDLVMQALNV
jgi:hypothetical protein